MHPPDRQDLSIEPAPPPYQANSVKKPTILPMAPPAKPTPAPFTEIDIEEPPPPPSRTVWYNVSDHKPFYFVVMALLVMVVVGVTVPLVVIKGGGDNTQINIGAPDTPPDTPPDTTAPTSTTGTAPVSTASSATLSTPTSHPLLISTTSNLGAASVEADHNPRRLIIWQADSMELVAKDWTDKEETIYRISDQLDDLAIPLNDTALAVVNEGITHADYIHVFYVSEDAELQHIVFRDGTWERVGATDQGGPLSVHNDSQLSVAWHLRTPDDDSSAALVMLYQDQDGVLRLAVSENGPYGFDFWTTFDFARQSRDSTGPPVFSANGGLGHTIVSGWDAGRELGDGVSPVDVFLGDDGEVKLYACTVSGEEDDSSHDGLDILCLRWLADTENRMPLSESPPSQLGVVSRGLEGELDYDIVVLNSEHHLMDFPVDMAYTEPWDEGTDFGEIEVLEGTLLNDVSMEAIAVTKDGYMFVRASREILIFYLDGGGKWQYDGVLETDLEIEGFLAVVRIG